MELVTGYGGKAHITPENWADLNRGFSGADSYVMRTGRKFEAELISNNLLKIHDGCGIMQGRQVVIPKGRSDEVAIENGTQGMKRIDLIVERYTKNPDTKIETTETVIIKGTPGVNPAVPLHTEGDIRSGDMKADWPLYEVELSGLNIVAVKPLFKVLLDMSTINKDLSEFDIKEVREITMYDELDLDMLGDERTALFLIMSDTDGTFAFLISLIYSILFNRLCERADDVYGGRLPIHVRCLIDEAANIGQIPNLERLMATIRSREISACLVLQAQSQLKALYKDNMDTIIGNCDASLFLGGKEETTLKSWNSLLGKETIDLYNTSVTKGTQESHGQNFQKLGKDLMSMDEIAVMDGGKCLLQIRGVRPFLSRKYDITKHPNYKYLSDHNPKNAFDIEKFLSTRLSLRPGEPYRSYEISPEELTENTA